MWRKVYRNTLISFFYFISLMFVCIICTAAWYFICQSLERCMVAAVLVFHQHRPFARQYWLVLRLPFVCIIEQCYTKCKLYHLKKCKKKKIWIEKNDTNNELIQIIIKFNGHILMVWYIFSPYRVIDPEFFPCQLLKYGIFIYWHSLQFYGKRNYRRRFE